MSDLYEMNKSYRLSEAAEQAYLDCRRGNNVIAERVRRIIWSVHELTENGNVKAIRLANTGEILDIALYGYPFTKYELRTGMIVEVKMEVQEQYIVLGGKTDAEFGLVRTDGNSHLFTLEKAKKYVTTVIKHDPDYKFQIFKLHSIARAEKQEINVVFE
ncbi:hypothetical protein CPT_Metamorpho_064 [Klebsiella phage Metamorpho]|nr:hypothetical protein CPT_Metamorpho_064 [Klebsiella phage Metamorpho]